MPLLEEVLITCQVCPFQSRLAPEKRWGSFCTIGTVPWNRICRNGFVEPRIDEWIARYPRIEVDSILFSQHASGSNALIEMHKLVFGCWVDGSQQKGSHL